MIWARIQPDIIRNKKFKRASWEARLFYLESIFYCNLNETDGLLTFMDVSMLLFVLGDQRRDYRPIIDELVAANMWDVDSNTQEGEDQQRWWVHDYSDYQPVSAERAREVASLRDAQNKATQPQRWHFPERRAPQPMLRPGSAPKLSAVDRDILKDSRRFA